MTISTYKPISPGHVSTSIDLATADTSDSQVDNHRGVKSTIIKSLKCVANSFQPVIRPVCIVALSMASLGITVFTQRLIAASIRDISSPAPVTNIDEIRLEHASRNIGTELGTIGGAASGLTLGGAIALYKKDIAPHLAVGLTVISGTAIGAMAGMIYSFYVEHLPDGVEK